MYKTRKGLGFHILPWCLANWVAGGGRDKKQGRLLVKGEGTQEIKYDLEQASLPLGILSPSPTGSDRNTILLGGCGTK